jgi:hypothetical protein
MQRYIEQLIEDIRNASFNFRPPHRIWQESEADPEDEDELEDISYIEKYFAGEKEPISIITGIHFSALPDPDKLTDDQKTIISRELENLLEVFHFHLEFPESYPAHQRYPYIRNFWKEKHVVLSYGTSSIGFCDYHKDKCPFPGYCDICDEVERELSS